MKLKELGGEMVTNSLDLSTLAANNLQLLLQKLPDPAHHGALSEFVKLANNIGALDHYKVLPATARELVAGIKHRDGEEVCRVFLRCAIVQGVVTTLGTRRFADLPHRVAREQTLQFQRILHDRDCEAEWLDLDHDLFQKEFGLATLRLYAAGAQLVDYRCGVPRSLMIKGGWRPALRKLLLILQSGGFRPYFQIHTHSFMLDRFNEFGWEECYLCCAELYSIHPEVLGMYGSSWFYDPSLEKISPRLAYLRDTPTRGGAHLLFVETGGSAINNALSSSPTRRKLYDNGEYMPKSYMLLWSKERQLGWAANYLETRAAA
jgi:hypothetical protein